MTHAVDVVLFLLSAGLIVAAGIRVARSGDVIATETRLGGVWVGAILVAGATSLPELVTDVSAVRQGAPGIAAGDLFGSSMANMLILALADLLTRHTRILTRVALNQLAVGTLAICLTALATVGLVVPAPAVAGIGWAPAATGAAYLAGMRFLYRNRPEPPFGPAGDGPAAGHSASQVRRAAVGFVVAAVVIVLAAPLLASSTVAIAALLGISHGFAGVLLLAVITSLPEAVVTTASVRTGAYDLAVGNLLGSNCFNMAALAMLEVADGGGSLLADAGGELVVPAASGIVLMALAMLGVLDRSERSGRRIEIGPIVVIVAYVAALVLTASTPGAMPRVD